MIDLKDLVERIIEDAKENEKTALLQHDWSDSIQYHERDIKEALKEYFEDLPDSFVDYLLEISCLWPDEIYQYIEQGFPHARKGTFALASVGEIEIPQEELVQHYGLKTNKESVRHVVNCYTDLYVNDRGDGYISCEHDVVVLDFSKLDLEPCLEDWKERVAYYEEY